MTSASAFMQEMLNQGFASSDLVRGLLRKYIPKPDDALLPPNCQGDQSFYAVWNLESRLPHMPSDWTFDAAAFADELQARVVQPLIDGQALFTGLPYLTRLFTTMSADEMVRDPLFSFNPDLPDISNVHRVEATPLCDPGSTNQASRVQLTYEDNTRALIAGSFDQNTGAFQPNNPATAANPRAMIQVLGEDGAPLVIDHADAEALAIADSQIAGRKPSAGQSQIDQNANDNINNTGPFSLPRGNGTDDGGCTCQQLNTSSPNRLPLSAALALTLGLGAVIIRRRSR
jgi:hypothetical protein